MTDDVCNLISSSQLRKLLETSSTACCTLLIDCRSFTAFNSGHIDGALNVHCPPIVKRRSGGNIPLLHVVRSPEVREALEQGRRYRTVVVYDDASRAIGQLAPDSDARLSLNALEKIASRINANLRLLKGGFECFSARCRHLCVWSSMTSLGGGLTRLMSPSGGSGPQTPLSFLSSPVGFKRDVTVTSPPPPGVTLRSRTSDFQLKTRTEERWRNGEINQMKEKVTLRRDQGDPVEIKPWLYLGNIHHAARRQRLVEMGITALLNVAAQKDVISNRDVTSTSIDKSIKSSASESITSPTLRSLPHSVRVTSSCDGQTACEDTHQSEAWASESFTSMCLAISDNATTDIGCWFTQCIQFIESIRLVGGKVLVHCQAGISRSATMCIAYLMKLDGLSMDEAHDYVKARRSIISPNLNFMRQLSEFEAQLRVARQHPITQPLVTQSAEATADDQGVSKKIELKQEQQHEEEKQQQKQQPQEEQHEQQHEHQKLLLTNGTDSESSDIQPEGNPSQEDEIVTVTVVAANSAAAGKMLFLADQLRLSEENFYGDHDGRRHRDAVSSLFSPSSLALNQVTSLEYSTSTPTIVTSTSFSFDINDVPTVESTSAVSPKMSTTLSEHPQTTSPLLSVTSNDATPTKDVTITSISSQDRHDAKSDVIETVESPSWSHLLETSSPASPQSPDDSLTVLVMSLPEEDGGGFYDDGIIGSMERSGNVPRPVDSRGCSLLSSNTATTLLKTPFIITS